MWKIVPQNHIGSSPSGVIIILTGQFAVSGTAMDGTMSGVSGATTYAGNISLLGRE